ncbi:hypothetical protein MRX96_016117 [Rhipicephalus microplus]
MGNFTLVDSVALLANPLSDRETRRRPSLLRRGGTPVRHRCRAVLQRRHQRPSLSAALRAVFLVSAAVYKVTAVVASIHNGSVSVMGDFSASRKEFPEKSAANGRGGGAGQRSGGGRRPFCLPRFPFLLSSSGDYATVVFKGGAPLVVAGWLPHDVSRCTVRLPGRNHWGSLAQRTEEARPAKEEISEGPPVVGSLVRGGQSSRPREHRHSLSFAREAFRLQRRERQPASFFRGEEVSRFRWR